MKKMFSPFYASVVILIISLAVCPVSYAGKKHGGSHKPADTKPTEPTKQQYEALTAVNASASTITVTKVNIPSPSAKTLKVTDKTEILVNGAKATLNDLQMGMKISLTLGMDPTIAARIEATFAPK